MFASELPQWPRYRPQRVIGQGGFGTVYLCEDTLPTSAVYGQMVAVKAISLSALSDEETLMVMSEVSLLKNLEHPNIIKYYDSFLYEETEGEPSAASPAVAQWLCLVTEYMDGGDLSSLLKRYSKVQEDQHHNEENSNDYATEVREGEAMEKGSVPFPPTAFASQEFSDGPCGGADAFRWDSTSDGAGGLASTSRRSPPALRSDTSAPQLNPEPRAPLKRPRSSAALSAQRVAPTPKTFSSHKKKTGQSDAHGTHAGDGATTTTSDRSERGWEQHSSQHRRRLASTLRLALHSFTAARSTSDTDAARESAGTVGQATWISDAGASQMPPTPLAASEVGGVRQLDSALSGTTFGGASFPAEKERGDGDESSLLLLESQLPPQPDQLWVESFLITDIAKQCLDALSYLHALGILHRDIKPSNIYLSKQDGTVKIGDFGVSKLLQPSAPFATTFVGTPFYLCPELCMGDPYSYGADVWALGVLLYELYCLKLPFTADNVLGQIYVITEGVYDKAALRRPHRFAAAQRAVLEDLYGPLFAQSETLLHGLVTEMVEAMLTVDPARRPSAEALLSRIFDCAPSATARAGSSAGTSIAATPLHRHRHHSSSSSGSANDVPLSSSRGLDGLTGAAQASSHGKERLLLSLSGGAANGGAVTQASAPASACGAGEKDVARHRLGPAAADQHARWAGSLVQAASAARLPQHSRSSWSAVPRTPTPPSSSSSSAPPPLPFSTWSSVGDGAGSLLPPPPSPLPVAVGEAVSEPLAVKVRLSMLGMMQEMPDEQRGRLETRAAEEDAMDAAQQQRQRQRQRSLSISSPAGAMASVSGLEGTGPGLQRTTTMTRLPPLLSDALQRRDGTAGRDGATSPSSSPSPPPALEKGLSNSGARGSMALLSGTSLFEPRPHPPSPPSLVSSLLDATAGAEDDADALNRLIGAETRTELDAFLEEVPWLSNAEAFSAIPLSAGSDDVMLVARAHPTHQSPNRKGVTAGKRGSRSVKAGRATESLQSDAAAAAEARAALPTLKSVDGSVDVASSTTSSGGVPRLSPHHHHGHPRRQRACVTSALRRDHASCESPSASATACGGDAAPLQRRVSEGQWTAREGTAAEEWESASWHAGEEDTAALLRAQRGDGHGLKSKPTLSSAGSGCEAGEGAVFRGVGFAGEPATAAAAASAAELTMGSRGGVARSHRQFVAAAGARVRPISASHHDHDDGDALPQADSTNIVSATDKAPMHAVSATVLQAAPTSGDDGSVCGSATLSEQVGKGGFPVVPLLEDITVVPSPSSSSSAASSVARQRKGTGERKKKKKKKQQQQQQQEREQQSVPPTPKVHVDGHCEGYSTSELEALLRARLLAHHRKRQQQELRRQRAELAAQEATRAKARERMEAVFAAAYRERCGAASPASLRETASYHSSTTRDTLPSVEVGEEEEREAEASASLTGLSGGEATAELAGESGPPRPLRRVSTMPPAARATPPPETTTASNKQGGQQEGQEEGRHSLAPPAANGAVVVAMVVSSRTPHALPPASARHSFPSTTQQQKLQRAKGEAEALSRSPPSRPSPAFLDQTARRAVREEEVLRALSGRHTSPSTGRSNEEERTSNEASHHPQPSTDADAAGATSRGEALTRPVATGIAAQGLTAGHGALSDEKSSTMNSANVAEDVLTSELLINTPAIRRLRSAAALAAAVERQKALFRLGGTHAPTRVVVAPAWRPPHDSRDVPGLWETSSVEEDSEGEEGMEECGAGARAGTSVRGRLGRPAPAVVRLELRWRWSCPPSELDTDSETTGEDETDRESAKSSSSSRSSRSVTEKRMQKSAKDAQEASLSTVRSAAETSHPHSGPLTPPSASSLMWYDSADGGAPLKGSVAPSPKLLSPPSPEVQEDHQQQQQRKEEEERKRARLSAMEKVDASAKTQGDAEWRKEAAREMEGLRRQSSLIGSPMELCGRETTPEGFPEVRVPTGQDTIASLPSDSVIKRQRQQRHRRLSPGNADGTSSSRSVSSSRASSRHRSSSSSSSITAVMSSDTDSSDSESDDASRRTVTPRPRSPSPRQRVSREDEDDDDDEREGDDTGSVLSHSSATDSDSRSGPSSHLSTTLSDRDDTSADSRNSTSTAASVSGSTTTSSTSSTSSSSSSSSTDPSTSSSSSSSSSASEEEEDMSYVYAVHVDAATNRRFFDYVCPITVEVAGGLPSGCRVVTTAELLSVLEAGPPWPVASSAAQDSLNRVNKKASGIGATPTPTEDAARAAGPLKETAEAPAATASASAEDQQRRGTALKESSRITGDAAADTPPSRSASPVLTQTQTRTDADAMDAESVDDSATLSSDMRPSLFGSFSLISAVDEPSRPTSRAQTASTTTAMDASSRVARGSAQPVMHSQDEGPPPRATTAPAATQPSAPQTPLTDLRASPTHRVVPQREAPKKNETVVTVSTSATATMMVRGTKVPATSVAAAAAAVGVKRPPVTNGSTATTVAAPTAGRQEKHRKGKAAKKPDTAVKSAHSTPDGTPPPNGLLHDLSSTWRIRVPSPLSRPVAAAVSLADAAKSASVTCLAPAVGAPPPPPPLLLPLAPSTTTTASLTGVSSFIYLPLSLALRPVRERTRFVGLLWRLWTAIELADPALRRVLLGPARCTGSGESCSFAEAFGDWVATHHRCTRNGHGSGHASSRPGVGAAGAGNNNSSSRDSRSDTSARRSGKAAGAEAATCPASLWSLYFVDTRVNAAVCLQTDKDWAVVRRRVAEMGQLLPFIRLHLILHDAEVTSA